MSKYPDTAPLPFKGWDGINWAYFWKDDKGRLRAWRCPNEQMLASKFGVRVAERFWLTKSWDYLTLKREFVKKLSTIIVEELRADGWSKAGSL